MSTTLVTLALEAPFHSQWESLRQAHYPPALNRVPAHVTLFHALPGTEDVRSVLAAAAAPQGAFPLRVTGLRSLGGGVAFTLEAPKLTELQAHLAARFAGLLTPQDRQRFRPHVVVQNKVPAEQARALLHRLESQPLPADGMAVGLDWWEYLGGPWKLIERLGFAGAPQAV